MGGINGWIDGKVLSILQAVGIELPGGDGDKLRSIARAWDAMGDDLTGLGRAVDLAIGGLDAKDWSGAAHDAFVKHWQDQKKIIDEVAGNFHDVAGGLDSYATQIDGINKEIIDIGTQIAEMEVAGAALSFFTGFISDLVANTAVAAKVAKILELVKAFTAAAEKVAELLEKFTSLSAETIAVLEKLLTAVAKISGTFLEKGLTAFATNFVADSGSMMVNQALSGGGVKYGDDLEGGAWDAAGTAAFAGGGSVLAGGAKLPGALADALNGEGRAGTMVNGAVGNVAGSLTADWASGASGTAMWQDALTNAATGAYGNARNDIHNQRMTDQGKLGGDNLSAKGQRKDSMYRENHAVGLNTAVYAAGSGIESDVQALTEGQ